MTLYWSSAKTRDRYQCPECGGWFSSHKLKCPHRRRSVWDETPEEEARPIRVTTWEALRALHLSDYGYATVARVLLRNGYADVPPAWVHGDR